MAKQKTAYVCIECGAEYSKWQGQCAACKEWNSIQEVRLGSSSARSAPLSSARSGFAGALSSRVQDLSEINLQDLPRFSTTFNEFDRVLGGGLVPGSAILIGGHPGAG